MKKLILAPVALLVLCTTVFAQKPDAKQAAAQKAYMDTLQYALGVYLMKSLKDNGMTISNPAMLKKGMDDYNAKAKLMVAEASIEPRIAAYQSLLKDGQGKIMEDMLFSLLKKQPGVLVMGNGVHIAVVKNGEGRRPDLVDTVVMNVVGTLADGTKFIDSQKDNSSFMILVNQLVPGLQGAVMEMREGAVWRIFVPAALGYGAAGNGSSVPPNSPLIYDVALVSVRVAKH
jgi:FKBP-type peptidyl-prolyl cis-trans isomerase